jgi:nucleotide-binding universal stress UspA family protein
MIRNVLAPLGEDAREGARVAAALAVAKRFEGHVQAIFPLVRPATPNFAEASLAEVAAREWARRQEAGRAAEKLFLAAAAAAGVSAEARSEEGEPSELILDWGRVADLTVLGQPQEGGERALVEAVLLDLGRPVLMVPYAGEFPTSGDSVAVAWNGTRESARALQAGMPFLARARKVALIGCDLDGRQRDSARRLAGNLARRGIDARLEFLPQGDLPVGDVLLNAVADLGVDLLVMGAYGHSRARELVFGGATRSLLAHMTAPVLFAH